MLNPPKAPSPATGPRRSRLLLAVLAAPLPTILILLVLQIGGLLLVTPHPDGVVRGLREARFPVPAVYACVLAAVLFIGTPSYRLLRVLGRDPRQRWLLTGVLSAVILCAVGAVLQVPSGFQIWSLLSGPCSALTVWWINSAPASLPRLFTRGVLIALVTWFWLALAIQVIEPRFWRHVEVEAARTGSAPPVCFVDSSSRPWRPVPIHQLPSLARLITTAIRFNYGLTLSWRERRDPHFAVIDSARELRQWSFLSNRLLDASERFPAEAERLAKACAGLSTPPDLGRMDGAV